MSSRLRFTTAVLMLPLWAASACTLRGAFVEDDRLAILRPEDRSQVELPVTLEWRVTEFTVAPPDGSRQDDRGYFAIFIDRAPMPPGEDLESLAEDDLQCANDPGCPDKAWFRANGVFLTTETSLEIKHLVDTRPEERLDAPDRHEVTIVLLNGSSERIGETAFAVDFEVLRGKRAS